MVWTTLGLVGLVMLPAQAGMLISVQDLSALRNDPKLVILHAGSQKDYDAGHVPAARLVTLAGLSETGPGGLRLQLPPPEKLKEALEALGVSQDSKVVIYSGTEAIQQATRVWFTFDYLGLAAQASLLDGGLAAWRAAGRPISTEAAAAPARGRLDIAPQPAKVVSSEWIQARLADPDLQLVDARLPEFHSGRNPGQMPRAGRIPRASNVPYPSLLDENLRFLPLEELRRKLGSPGDAPVVTYCHIGLQATVPYFVARLLGWEAKLYDGSFQEWSQNSGLPVEKDE